MYSGTYFCLPGSCDILEIVILLSKASEPVMFGVCYYVRSMSKQRALVGKDNSH